MAEGEFQIAGSVIFDSTKLKTGTDEGARAIDALADQADRSADEINQSFDSIDTNVSTNLTGDSGTFGRMADDVETQGSKVKEAGGEIGAEFASNLSETFESGDVVGGIMGTLGGLIPAFGPLGIGLGIGGLLIGQVIKGAQQRQAEMTAAIDTMLGGVENDFKESMAKIYADLRKGMDKINVLTDLGGGSLSTGLQKARDYAAGTGLSLKDVVSLLQGRMSPELRTQVDLLSKQSGTHDEIKTTLHGTVQVSQDMTPIWGDLLEKFQAANDKMGTAKEDARDLHDLTTKTADRQKYASDAAADYADSIKQAADDSSRLAANMDRVANSTRTSADQANGVT